MIEAAKSWQTTRNDLFAEIDKLKADEIEREILELQDSAKKPDKKHLDRLNKERATIAAAYGALDVGAMLQSVLRLPGALEMTLDTSALVDAWPEAQKRMGLPSMPKSAVDAAPSERRSGALFVSIIDAAIRAWAGKLPLTPSLSYEALIRDLTRNINQKELPTAGLVFDADHAAALRRVDVFVSRDKILVETARALAKSIEEVTGGKMLRSVAASHDELRGILEQGRGR
jgi:hypothetical protein